MFFLSGPHSRSDVKEEEKGPRMASPDPSDFIVVRATPGMMEFLRKANPGGVMSLLSPSAKDGLFQFHALRSLLYIHRNILIYGMERRGELHSLFRIPLSRELRRVFGSREYPAVTDLEPVSPDADIDWALVSHVNRSKLRVPNTKGLSTLEVLRKVFPNYDEDSFDYGSIDLIVTLNCVKIESYDKVDASLSSHLQQDTRIIQHVFERWKIQATRIKKKYQRLRAEERMQRRREAKQQEKDRERSRRRQEGTGTTDGSWRKTQSEV